MMEDVLTGEAEAPISHTGGEFRSILDDWEQEICDRR